MQRPLSSAAVPGALAAALAMALLAAPLPAGAQAKKLKVGLMLPYSGTYAALGNAITNGWPGAQASACSSP